MRIKPAVTYVLGVCESSLQVLKSLSETEVEAVRPENLAGKIRQISAGTLWVSLPAWQSLDPGQQADLACASKVLLLPPQSSGLELEQLGCPGFSAILAEPFTPARAREAADKARLEQNIYRDAHRMTREIMLERELSERKTANLHFLLRFLTGTAGLLEHPGPDQAARLLRAAAQIIDDLLPLRNVGAFLWADDNGARARMFIPALPATPAWRQWVSALENAGRAICETNACTCYECCPLPRPASQAATPGLNAAYTPGNTADADFTAAFRPISETGGDFAASTRNSAPAATPTAAPVAELSAASNPAADADLSPELSLAVPLRLNTTSIGVALVSLAEECPLGRDTVEALEAAMAHLAVALRAAALQEQATDAEHSADTERYSRATV